MATVVWLGRMWRGHWTSLSSLARCCRGSLGAEAQAPWLRRRSKATAAVSTSAKPEKRDKLLAEAELAPRKPLQIYALFLANATGPF